MPITTAGDRDRTSPFGQIGERGVFVKEIEEALLAGRIDVAVHSAKDMTSTDTDGLVVGAYLERDDPRDALDRRGRDPARNAHRHRLGAPPRAAARHRPSLSIEPMRGNVETRIRKQRERGLDAIVLAACGLDRLGLGDEIGPGSSPSRCCPRPRRARSRSRCAPAKKTSSLAQTTPRPGDGSSRSALCVATIGGGCLAPVAAHHDGVTLRALIAAEDGAWIEQRSGDDPVALAEELAGLAAAR